MQLQLIDFWVLNAQPYTEKMVLTIDHKCSQRLCGCSLTATLC